MWIESYTGRFVKWSDAVSRVKEGYGQIVTLVVRDQADEGPEGELVYGFFYVGEDQTVWDVHLDKRPRLRTVSGAHHVYNLLLEVMPDAWGIAVPFLTEANLVLPGKVVDSGPIHVVQRMNTSA